MSDQNIAVIGASGGLGSAFVKLFSEDPSNTVHAFSRSGMKKELANVYYDHVDLVDEESIKVAAIQSSQDAPLDLVIVATGVLHGNNLMPEKCLRDLNCTNFEQIFLTNTIGPALVAKYFLPKLQHTKRAVFAVLSARVGSIADNRLGGWYAYRASKAALNMLLKTISIEIARRQKGVIVVGLHPGTVATGLSKPFQKRVPTDKLFSADYSVRQMCLVLEGLSSMDSGKFFAWDGSEIPY
jgi:NAD(P)-dependent dehydrogenase (short-subunit alcohol dehydrogenase family)